MFVKRLTLSAAMLALLCTLSARAQAPQAASESLQPVSAIRAAAEAGALRVIDPSLKDVKLSTVSLDPRLRLAACAGKLDTFANAPRGSQSRVTVRVSCPSPAWTLNVPVEMRRSHSVLVLRRAVGRGEALTAADVTVNQRELAGLSSPFVARPEDLAGRLTRRPLPEGTALTADSLSAALLIKRGQQVTLVAQSRGFEVRAPGKAMADAAANQRVRVQNLNSLKIIEGTAETDGVVRVQP
jgi:flagellar basal body P-ring formation protein FlgA